ncbi:MAG: L-glutamate gamma-semialdehyde dehydrogenase [Thermoanaerobaculales bacterium]|nr:L-glutamate gamma-semialdehyde dehydrogenase [Thermoanaerobaculales bacterium]
MANGIVPIPPPVNETIRSYAPGSPEKASLKARIRQMLGERIEMPLIIGGKEVRTGKTAEAVCPHDHRHVLGTYHLAGEAEVRMAIDAAAEAWRSWSETPWEHRAAVMLKAAELLAGPWRDTLNAACMLNQSKSVFQAEIDAACELIDFWRFNPHYMRFIYEQQPESMRGHWDYVEYRALEGFVFAVTPFNFASIAGNLPTAPALMGNTVLWKPASSTVVTGWYLMKLMEAAGFPAGVINFIPGSGSKVGNPVLASPRLAGIHFTGSTAVFHGMWRAIGDTIAAYRTYPRIVGETGGKDFIFAHASADIDALATAMVRGAFEYQGQKCSAASRAYVPRSLWKRLKERLVGQVAEITMGPPTDFRNFFNAVIDAGAFADITGYIQHAKDSSEATILCGGSWDDSEGYYIQPTVVETSNPRFKLMQEEIFGPVLTVFVYEDAELDATLELCDTTSPYALTGAIFAEERTTIIRMADRLRHAAGNFYINDKPTGAVVGQQPFGGSRASGTNDKAGSYLNLIRWTSQRTIKENFVPPKHFAYPFMGEE